MGAIGEGLVRLVVHLDHQAVGADRGSRASQGQNHVAFARAMAGVNDDGQMAQPLHRGHDTKVKRIAGVIGEGAYPAFAQNHLVVALAHHVLGSHQQLVQGRRHAALHQHRLTGPAGALEQGKVLHVAGPDLDHIGILRNQVETLVVQSFGNNPQAELVPYLGHDLQPVFAHALKSIGGSARLIGAPAKELGSRRRDLLRNRKSLLPGFDGARSGNHRQVPAANGRIGAREA